MDRLGDGLGRCLPSRAQHTDFRMGLRRLPGLKLILDRFCTAPESLGVADNAGRFHGQQRAWDCALAIDVKTAA